MNRRPGSTKPSAYTSQVPTRQNPAMNLATSQMKKKVEGFDGGQPRADTHSRMHQSTRAGNIGQNFNQSIDNFRSGGPGTKEVENQYISALQEEIKILEYQMKILKDKEIEQQAAVSQIDRFFSDGVPLNDNILALKTQYQNKKSEEQKIIDNLRNNILITEKETADLEAEITHYRNNTSAINKEKLKVEADMQSIIDE